MMDVDGLGVGWVVGMVFFGCWIYICIDVYKREPNLKKLACFFFWCWFWLNRAAFFLVFSFFSISLFRPSCTTWDV